MLPFYLFIIIYLLITAKFPIYKRKGNTLKCSYTFYVQHSVFSNELVLFFFFNQHALLYFILYIVQS